MRIVSRPSKPRKFVAAFTLIELLTVVAVIGILAAIIIPTVGGARDAATRAKTKAQFSQWAAAMELFRQEYGFYPDIAVNGLVDADRFAAELTGRTLTGATVAGGSWGNRKGLSFYSLGMDELSKNGTELVDGFDNDEIAMRVDSNRDGLINSSDSGAWVAVVGAAGLPFAPDVVDGAVPTIGLRAKVVFYSAGRGRDASDLILSWR
jgi:prepilin-type N-terminal cleavage/methylation domain-containing protein